MADQNGFEEVAYEYFAQAFAIYEEAVSDSRAQFQAVCVIASALHSTRNFGKENYDTLITKCALHGSKLLKKVCDSPSTGDIWFLLLMFVGELAGSMSRSLPC